VLRVPHSNWSLELVLAGVSGLTIGAFDRSCRYTAMYGETDGRSLGKVVGEINPPYAEVVLEAALAAVNHGRATLLVVPWRDHVYEVRISPVMHPLFGIIGGVAYSWDITHRGGGG
jgi:hypothetical protein